MRLSLALPLLLVVTACSRPRPEAQSNVEPPTQQVQPPQSLEAQPPPAADVQPQQPFPYPVTSQSESAVQPAQQQPASRMLAPEGHAASYSVDRANWTIHVEETVQGWHSRPDTPQPLPERKVVACKLGITNGTLTVVEIIDDDHVRMRFGRNLWSLDPPFAQNGYRDVDAAVIGHDPTRLRSPTFDAGCDYTYKLVQIDKLRSTP